MQRERDARPAGWSAGRAAGAAASGGSARHIYSTTSGALFYNARGQVCGRLEGGWLVKRVNTRIHQLRKPPAWAVDAAHLARLEALGAAGVMLTDERGDEWRATVAAFRRYGIPLDRGHGRQVALPLGRWQRAMPSQLSLFGGAA